MTENSSNLSRFTDQLLNLANNLCSMYPDDYDLNFTKDAIEKLKSYNPRKLQELFEQYVAIYETQINNKEADFFLEKDIVNEDLKVEADQSVKAMSIMDNLKKYWKHMDEKSQENIWQYLKVLILLNKRAKSDKSKSLYSF